MLCAKQTSEICVRCVRVKTDLEREWFDGGLGWVYFYRGMAHEKLLEMKEALDDYNESIDSWNFVPELTTANIHDQTPTQRQIRTAHFQRGDLLCGMPCYTVRRPTRHVRALAAFQFDAGHLTFYACIPWCPAGYCGGEQIGAMRSQLGKSIDLDAAIADYSYVINSILTYPGTTNHAVSCARRGENPPH